MVTVPILFFFKMSVRGFGIWMFHAVQFERKVKQLYNCQVTGSYSINYSRNYKHGDASDWWLSGGGHDYYQNCVRREFTDLFNIYSSSV